MRAGRSVARGHRHGLQEGPRRRSSTRTSSRSWWRSSSSCSRPPGVKGFAFTLGIGTLVSLFTAVLATQAILGTLRGTRLHPLARRRSAPASSAWSFSRLHGRVEVVLLDVRRDPADRRAGDRRQGPQLRHRLRVAARASRRRSTQPATATRSATRSRRSASTTRRSRRVDEPGARRQRRADLDRAAAAGARSTQVDRRLDEAFGGTPNFSSIVVGPTFGETVANYAIIAIIASLLVISAYIALRFEWKFAVPVLIALMHDLLITAGVYSLTGREVTSATVAALLTILGLLALRHDHRVRPHPREHAAHAARRVLADRQPLDVRGADRSLATVVLHAAADPRADAVRRRDAAGLRLRAARRHHLRHLLVGLHRHAGADALEGARAGLPRAAARGSCETAASSRPTRRGDRRPGRRRAEGQAHAPARHRAGRARRVSARSSRSWSRDLDVEERRAQPRHAAPRPRPPTVRPAAAAPGAARGRRPTPPARRAPGEPRTTAWCTRRRRSASRATAVTGGPADGRCSPGS